MAAVLLAILTLLGLYVLKVSVQFARNLQAAKQSGITYTIVPVFVVNRLFQLSCIFLIPLMRKLPKHWTEPWFDLTLEWGWSRRYEPFKRFGSDTFIAVSPERNVLYTADADVIAQMTTRRNDFPKPTEVYGALKIYGNNLVASEGQTWRQHRKITSPSFTEKNNHLVWRETLSQCQAMLNCWLEGENASKDRSKPLYSIADDAMKLSLHVISSAGFGVRLQWQTTDEGHSGHDGDHEMSYTDALSSLLHNELVVLMTPRPLLKLLPFKTTKTAYKSYQEWGKYMKELFESKKAAIISGNDGNDLDLMTALIKGAGITSESLGTREKALPQSLSEEEVLGNAFVFILAGHETAANSIHFCLALLAIDIASQRRLQSDLDEILQGRPVSEQSYEEVIPKLFGSMAGAVMNEELRLVSPVVGIPKSTPKDSPQTLEVDGKNCTVPAGIYINLMAACVHRNPKYWPTGPPSDPTHPIHPLSNLDNDLEEFRPERWLLNGEAKSKVNMPEQDVDIEASSLGVNTAADTSDALYRPPKGAYIPFSEGFRSCIGRRFAQVEILAVLATIFSQYSVELAVDAYATDEQVAKMSEDEKKDVWQKAKQEVQRQMREDMGSVITLQLRKGAIGLRLVKRGKERFDWR